MRQPQQSEHRYTAPLYRHIYVLYIYMCVLFLFPNSILIILNAPCLSLSLWVCVNVFVVIFFSSIGMLYCTQKIVKLFSYIVKISVEKKGEIVRTFPLLFQIRF